MVRPATHHTYAERRHLGTVHIDSRSARSPRPARADEVHHALLQQSHEFAHLDAPAREVDERVQHDLSRAVIGHVAAAVRGDHGDAIGHLHGRCALAEGVYRRMLEQPELVRRLGITLEREAAHRLPGGRIVDAPKALERDVGHDRHSTMTTAGWSHSSWYRASSCSREVARTTQVTLR